jgi:hypothetical protein
VTKTKQKVTKTKQKDGKVTKTKQKTTKIKKQNQKAFLLVSNPHLGFFIGCCVSLHRTKASHLARKIEMC